MPPPPACAMHTLDEGLLARNHKCLRERVRDFIVFPFWFGYDASKRCGGEEMGHVVTKSDLVQVAAKAGNLSRAAAGEAVNAVFDAIVENVAKGDRKSTRLNSSHLVISYAVFCLK